MSEADVLSRVAALARLWEMSEADVLGRVDEAIRKLNPERAVSNGPEGRRSLT